MIKLKSITIFLCCLLLIASSGVSQTQVVDEAYFQSLFSITEQAMRFEQESKAREVAALMKHAELDFQDFDAIYYDLNLAITASPQNLTATVTGVFRSQIDGLETVNLNFDSREEVSPWQDFIVSGNVNSWTHADWVLTVQLDRRYDVGENFNITVHYSGVPRTIGIIGFAFNINSYGDPVIYTLSEPYMAQTWWPCKDDPADKADSVSVSITVPEEMIAVSNGSLISQTNLGDDRKIYVWKENYPIATYLVSLAISEYAVFKDQFEYVPGQFMSVEYYVYPAKLNDAKVAFAPMVGMLEIFSDLFGLYPFVTEKYGHALMETHGFAMENQTITSVGTVNQNWEYIYAHELVHQWFGDMVTCENWGDIWLNEGFATYGEALYAEVLHGTQAYHAYMNARLGSLRSWATDPIYRYDTSDPWYIFHSTVFYKGAWVLHMLRRVLGDSTFFQILHDYPNHPDFKYKTATTSQFRDFCERESGMDFDWFFQQWIYEPYYPVYFWSYNYNSTSNGHALHLEIKQMQKLISSDYDHLYKMPIEIRIDYVDGTSTTVTVWDSLEVQSCVLPLDTIPQQVEFDPQIWILKSATKVPVTSVDRLPERIMGYELHQNYPNPFNPNTTFEFSIPKSGFVTLKIYNTLGEEVATLVSEILTSGSYTYDWNATGHESGIYFYKIEMNNFVMTKKCLLIK